MEENEIRSSAEIEVLAGASGSIRVGCEVVSAADAEARLRTCGDLNRASGLELMLPATESVEKWWLLCARLNVPIKSITRKPVEKG